MHVSLQQNPLQNAHGVFLKNTQLWCLFKKYTICLKPLSFNLSLLIIKPCQVRHILKDTKTSKEYAKENNISPLNEFKKKWLSDERKDAIRCNVHTLEICEMCKQTNSIRCIFFDNYLKCISNLNISRNYF